MPRYPRIREQHIAVFGGSGSGKTVLLSSFFGHTQEGTYSNGVWDLVADDAGQGRRLYQNYLGMRDRATVPAGTHFASTTYCFSVKLKSGDNAATRRRPFDVLRLAWHDYPGEWFEESPSSEEESKRRVETFRSLLRSDVALLIVDGQKLLDHQGEEDRYLRSLLTDYRQGLLRLKGDLLAGEERLVEFPRIWIFALSKADLLPDWNVDSFRDLMIGHAAEPIGDFSATIESLVDTPGALSIGEDFLLLSSAKFESSVADTGPVAIDVSKRVGLDLILPVASMLPLERRVQWGERMEIPRKVLDTLADGADVLAVALVGGQVLGRVVARVPIVGPLASKFVGPALIAVLKLAEPKLREINAEARKRHDFMTAMLSQFKLDLIRGGDDKLFIKSKG